MVHRVRAMIGQLYTKARSLSGYLQACAQLRHQKKVGAIPVLTSINAHQSDVAGCRLSCVQIAQLVVVNPRYGFAQGAFIATLVFRQLLERTRLNQRTGPADS